MARVRPFDPIIFISVATLVLGGFLVFMSASLGLLAREGAQFSDVALSQFLIGLVGGGIALFITSLIPYRLYRQYALYFFVGGIVLTLLVFVPGIGIELNGARRWLDLGITTMQPAEILKIVYVLYLAVWLSGRRGGSSRGIFAGLVPFGVITALVGFVLLLQPDTDTFLVIAAAGGAMFFASGAQLKEIAIIVLVGVVVLTGVIIARPYLIDRITTFLDPSQDPLGASYQIQQSLIAVGSGQIVGRGFGQSVQKFNYLPEPISDSIFAVYAEEFGFVGSIVMIGAFLMFSLRGLWIAARAPDVFGGLIAVGVVILIVGQSFLNIGSMLALVPLSGLPLLFVSHGGTALFFALVSVGILLNISRYKV